VDRRLASMQPAVPPPMMMKSYSFDGVISYNHFEVDEV
jgi:hypothetical protein